MAVVAPVFFLLVFGLVEFGRMTMVQQSLSDAARAGCRKAILATSNSKADAEQTVRDHLQPTIANAENSSVCRVTVSPSSLNGMEPGTQITTAVEVNFSDVSWLPPSFLGNAVLRRESTMRRE